MNVNNKISGLDCSPPKRSKLKLTTSQNKRFSDNIVPRRKLNCSSDPLLQDTPFNDSSIRKMNIPPSGDSCVSLIGLGGGEPCERKKIEGLGEVANLADVHTSEGLWEVANIAEVYTINTKSGWGNP